MISAHALSRRQLVLSAGATGLAALSPAQAPANKASRAFARIVSEADDTMLKRSPLDALARGDLRYAHQFGDYITDDFIALRRSDTQRSLSELASIDRASLSPEQQVSFDVFRWKCELSSRRLSPEIVGLTVVQPLDQQNGLHVIMADISAGGSLVPFNTLADYENNLKRLRGFSTYLHRCIGRMREGLARGVAQPKIVGAKVLDQLNGVIARGIENSPFYEPVKKFPASIPQGERLRLRSAYAETIRDAVLPAYIAVRDFMRDVYLPRARTSIGLCDMPGGRTLYAFNIEEHTSLAAPPTPESLYHLGLQEIHRIRSEMEKVKREVGSAVSLAAFNRALQQDPKFQPRSAEALAENYTSIQRRVEAQLPRLFSPLPKTHLVVRPVPAISEKTASNAHYEQGAPDGSRPGTFYFNTYDLKSRNTFWTEILFLHEGEPGHHLQISLAQENTTLPAFQRFGDFTAYSEGWGLYAETLGPELGLFTDPYQRYGFLTDDMFRAVRLVVDTGIHAKGWPRRRAISFMLENTPSAGTSWKSRWTAMSPIPARRSLTRSENGKSGS